MHKIAIIPINESSATLAATIEQELAACVLHRNAVTEQWHNYDAFIFIGAMGICVRTIASLIEDKHTDPAVVCLDSMGRRAISVLSGHVGGANELTRRVAGIIGAEPVITTHSDGAGLWALDTMASRFGWSIAQDRGGMNACIFAFVNRKPTALLLEIRDRGTDYLESTLPDHVTIIHDIAEADPIKFRLVIIVSPFSRSTPTGMLTLHFVPRVASIGFGLAHHPADFERIYDRMNEKLVQAGVLPCAMRYSTIDVKADEPFVQLLKDRGEDVTFFNAQQLAEVEVPNPSDTVARHVGTPSVCEAAAILGANNGILIVPKQKGDNFTVALAIDRIHLREGHIEIVGAGPGDPDLVSVRGRRMLERADLILYAGSLVPRELTDCHKPGAVVRSSASMALDEQCALMKQFYDRGKFIVRLHTGDPCIFGAIQEQMAFFDRHHMSYHITPGISSFLAAAAELRSQFTIPERTQTIILTRGEGRTPMPEKEQLHLLARSQSTMCIFLSAAIVDDVQQELLMEYPADTPVAACYHLTWPDQRIYRGVLKNLARIVHDNKLTLTTMLVVGEAIDNRKGLSELYNKHFTHLYRKGDA
ncbi:MAG: precorrin-4 C(11)-methyltransferase [Muribaculaceae bacterium]|nr:precorrin-4 C(11)-methyltransferase [Muribaculaceae bacterium]